MLARGEAQTAVGRTAAFIVTPVIPAAPQVRAVNTMVS